MKVADVLEQNENLKKQVDDIVNSYEKTKNDKGENIDSFFSKLLVEKKLWNPTK